MANQMPPWLFRVDGNPFFAGDVFATCSAFLVCGGPSINTQPLHLLSQRGVLACAVNNAATILRPQVWVAVDPAKNFSDAIWRDPGIQKFCPVDRFTETIAERDANGDLAVSEHTVGGMPNVIGFQLSDGFKAKSYLTEPGFSMGCAQGTSDDLGNHGGRSVMLVAIKLLYVLGVRRIYLLGCDFRMRYGRGNYAFTQNRSRSSVRGNNATYRILNERFTVLRPEFENAGLEIFNCTPNSGLTAFRNMEFKDAIKDGLERFPKSICTDGMYDWKETKIESEP